MPEGSHWQGFLIIALDPMKKINDVDRSDNVFVQYVKLDEVSITTEGGGSYGKCSVNPHLNDLNCKFCKQNVQETQEHLEECPETEYERRGLVLSDWNGKLGFWRRMLFKIAAVAPAVPQPGATIDQISQICIVAT